MFGLRTAVLAIGLSASAPEAGTAANVQDLINHAAFAELAADDQIHAEIVEAQVLLDRASISPGEINGRQSESLIEATQAFAEVHGLSATTTWSDEFWRRLTSSVSGPVIVEYTLQAKDVKGPFIEIPERLEDMIGLKALGYSSPREALAEKFHMSEELLATLNPDASFQVGERILVANIRTEQARANAARITVDKERQTVAAYSSDGKLLGFFPASVGSEDKPTPSGTLNVTAISSEPSFHYNPKYRFKEVATQTPFDLNPGPNNPLGSVWIGLSKPSYGIHGTPEPSLVGKSRSHGCVRVTNWDAQRLAVMVRKGVPVTFIDQRDEARFFVAY